jgi:hypothetical protein
VRALLSQADVVGEVEAARAVARQGRLDLRAPARGLGFDVVLQLEHRGAQRRQLGDFVRRWHIEPWVEIPGWCSTVERTIC